MTDSVYPRFFSPLTWKPAPLWLRRMRQLSWLTVTTANRGIQNGVRRASQPRCLSHTSWLILLHHVPSTHNYFVFSIPCASLRLYLDLPFLTQLQAVGTRALKDPNPMHLSTDYLHSCLLIQPSFLGSHGYLLRFPHHQTNSPVIFLVPLALFWKHVLPVGIPHGLPGHLSLLVSEYYELPITTGKFTGQKTLKMSLDNKPQFLKMNMAPFLSLYN